MKTKLAQSKEPRRIKKRLKSSPAKRRRTPPINKLRRIAANARATLHRQRIDAKKQHKRLLTVAQAAAMYRVCQNTVYKWCKGRPKLKKRVSGLVLLNPILLQRYLLFGRKRRR
jgi:hypothetical protein